jgi:hypothetical protein
MAPPKFPDEPPSEPPYLNATASWHLGDAWFLFSNIIENCGYPTAKFIFEKCIKDADELEALHEKVKSERTAHALAPAVELPPIAEIDAMNREQICRWYARFSKTDQAYDERSHRLLNRYLSFEGQPKDFKSNVTPIKRKGANTHKPPGAELPALFAAEKARNTRLGNEQIAEIILKKHGPKYGKSVESIVRTERGWRKKNRKI